MKSPLAADYDEIGYLLIDRNPRAA